MEITQSEAAQYFLEEWPEELEENRQKEFSERTYERLDSEYGSLNKIDPRNSYSRQAASELAQNPEEPPTDRAQDLKEEIEKTRYHSGPRFDEEEFAEWEMEWMFELLPMKNISRMNSDFRSGRLGSREAYQWNDLEISYDLNGKYAGFTFEPIEDPSTLKDIATELGTEIEFESMTKYNRAANEEGLDTFNREHWLNVDHKQDGLEIQAGPERLGVKVQTEYSEAEDILNILGWEDQTTEIETL